MGAIESISVGEIRLSLRQSLVKLGVGFLSRDPKLQVLICDLEVVIRSSKKSTHKSRSKKPRSSGRGKWMVVANMARFLSISVTDLVLKTSKASLDVKELRVDISKDGGSEGGLFVKMQLVPINVHLSQSLETSDQSVTSDESITTKQFIDNACPPFSCEEFSLLCEFGHNREAGVVVKNLDTTCGEVRINLYEDLLFKEKDPDTSPQPFAEVSPAKEESAPAKKQRGTNALSAVSKYNSIFPEKVGFTLPKLDVKFIHRGYGLVVENNVMGIQLKCITSKSVEEVGESLRLDVQLEFSEIYLLREVGISIVEVLKLGVVSSVYIPLQI